MAFEAITTQEDFDRAIKARLERERATITASITAQAQKDAEAKYADYEDLKAKAMKIDGLTADLTKANDALTKAQEAQKTAEAQVTAYKIADMKRTAARNNGLPESLAGRISGTTEEEIATDAKALKDILGPGGTPARSTERSVDLDETAAALKGMLADMI